MAAVGHKVLSNILGSSRTKSCCYNSIQMLSQVCQVMHKNSREAGMQKMKNIDQNILKNLLQILAFNLVSNQLSLLKTMVNRLLANQNYQFKRMSYTEAADLQYLILTMALANYPHIMLLVLVNSTKKFVIIWLLKKGFLALLTLGSQPCFLGEDCLASLGEECLAACGGKCLVSEGKNALLLSKTHCQILLDISAWLPEEHQLGIPEDFTAWLPRRGLQLGSSEEDFSLAS